jgi:hypothetical protein
MNVWLPLPSGQWIYFTIPLSYTSEERKERKKERGEKGYSTATSR